MLTTLPIEETSYSGNLLVLDEISKLLCKGKTSIDAKKGLAACGIPIVGDQLTHSRLAHLKELRSNDINSYERLQWLLPSFGWFHLEMTLANAILTTHRGSPESHGFTRSIHQLGTKGLPENNKKPYFHTVETLLDVELKARVQALWLWVTGKKSIRDVYNLLDTPQGPEKMLGCAQRILDERTSTAAIKRLEDDNKGNDEVLRDSSLCTRDLLLYSQVRKVTRNGDVGHLEALLPRLALSFKGANCSNYSSMLLEYMLWSKEAPPGVR